MTKVELLEKANSFLDYFSTDEFIEGVKDPNYQNSYEIKNGDILVELEKYDIAGVNDPIDNNNIGSIEMLFLISENHWVLDADRNNSVTIILRKENISIETWYSDLKIVADISFLKECTEEEYFQFSIISEIPNYISKDNFNKLLAISKMLV